ncbi:MAG: exo-beta-N-acetylmuramidase NamZ domain-containing protein [Vulcanimicrobiota bacterium]
MKSQSKKKFPPRIMTGLDVLETVEFNTLKNSKVGLLINSASVNRNLVHAIDVFSRAENFELTTLFGPQHGIYGTTQANMIEWKSYRDPRLGIPVYSLYGKNRKPTPEMLKDIDTLVIDLPDVGSRYYTYIWTVKLCMEGCAENGVRVVILDRPNPLGGEKLEGPVLKNDCFSFVGMHKIPIRHSMTLGELATLINNEEVKQCHLDVVLMKDWNRKMYFDDTGLFWVLPSPNMPTPATALVYPGFCLLEATNISEGRGTCRPFEICGAPFIDPELLCDKMEDFDLPGVVFRPMYFKPTFDKYQGKLCGGFQMHITDKAQFKPVLTAVYTLFTLRDICGDDFQWNQPPYEYEYEKMPIDILWGDSTLRKAIDSGNIKRGIQEIEEKIAIEIYNFESRWIKSLLYKPFPESR